MAVFYSFHYDRDIKRVKLIENMRALDFQKVLNHQEWEQVKKGGDTAVRNWIDSQMLYKNAVIVLIGKETSSRRWVKYEIKKSWEDKRPLLGIRIHGLSSMGDGADPKGSNPFDVVAGVYGVPVFDPTQTDWRTGKIDTKATYNYLADNLKSWSTQGTTRL